MGRLTLPVFVGSTLRANGLCRANMPRGNRSTKLLFHVKIFAMLQNNFIDPQREFSPLAIGIGAEPHAVTIQIQVPSWPASCHLVDKRAAKRRLITFPHKQLPKGRTIRMAS